MERSGNSSQAPKAYTHSATRPNGTKGANGYPTSTPRTAARSTIFDPSMPSFLPGNDSHAHQLQTQESLASKLARIERNVMSYNTAHQMEIIQFEDNTSKNSADISGLTSNVNDLKADLANTLNDLSSLRANISNGLSDLKSEVSGFHEQSSKNSDDLDDMKIILRNDFNTIGSQIRASNAAVESMNARVTAADEERSLMRSLAVARTLAEAESSEQYAKRLRESVRALQGPSAMLQFTAAPAHQESTTDAPAKTLTHISTPDVSHQPVTVTSSSTNAISTSEPTAPAQQVSTTTEAGTSANLLSAGWQPQAIAGLVPLNVSYPNTATFTWEELHRHLGGAQYSPGLYLTSSDSKDKMLKGRTYWLLEAQYEPLAPTTPGHHGAKLTAFYNDNPTDDGDFVDEKDYADVPVFVCLEGGQGYTYLGQYSQNRYSDRLSHSELFEHVPTRVLEYWASQLGDPHRPAWVTEKLISHFWPAPTYEGPNPSDSNVTTPGTGVSQPQDADHVIEKRVLRALERYAGELKEWKKASRIKANLLSEEAIMATWAKSDLDEEKGLRLWLEYLECVGFDEEFYGKLVALKGRKTDRGKAVARDHEHLQENGSTPQASGSERNEQSKNTAPKTRESQGSSQAQGSIESNETLKPTVFKRANRPAGLKIASAQAAKEAEEPKSEAIRGEPESNAHPKAVEAARVNPFTNADLEAARKMHDKATKAGEKKPRGGRAAKDIKW